MNNPHFRTNAVMINTYERLAERNPAAAVRAVVNAGYSVTREDIETPHLEAVEAMSKDARADYHNRFAAEIGLERQALAVFTGQGHAHRRIEDEAVQRAAEDRRVWVEARANELEVAYFAGLRAQWRAQAEAEHANDKQPVNPKPNPEPKKPRRAA